MVFVPNGLKAVRALPDISADRLTRVGPGEKLFGTGKTAPGVAPVADSGWIEIFLPDDRTTGWVIASEFTEEADPVPRPLDEEFFVRSCLTVEREVNSESTIAPWYVAADFLVARAIMATGLSAGSGDPSQPLGPLAMLPAEWDAFLASGTGPAAEFAFSDRRLLAAQIFACAYSASRSSKELSDVLSPGANPGDGAYVPSYLDLFLAYLIDVPTAAKLADPSLDKTQTLATLGFSADMITALSARSGLSNTKASSTVSAFLKNASETLARLLDAAFDRMKTLAADELPKGSEAVPPWLAIARSELDRPVSETVNSDRLLAYFQTINFPVGGNIPHWCGAFVGFCVKTAGAPIPVGPARAANWKTWGDRSFPIGASDIPLGAVVVLKPQDPTTSGHVAFFEAFAAARKVELLGGNQDDAVSKKEFDVAEISAIRLQARELPIGAANSFDMTRAKVKPEFQRYGDLIIERFKVAGFDTIHQLAAALANAIRESELDPNAASKPPERSYGLFQCNQTAGLGKGYSVAQLKDPELNIALIIAEAKRSRSFVSASTLEAAVEAFVKYVERPRDTVAEIAIRLKIAKLLLSV